MDNKERKHAAEVRFHTAHVQGSVCTGQHPKYTKQEIKARARLASLSFFNLISSCGYWKICLCPGGQQGTQELSRNSPRNTPGLFSSSISFSSTPLTDTRRERHSMELGFQRQDNTCTTHKHPTSAGKQPSSFLLKSSDWYTLTSLSLYTPVSKWGLYTPLG